MGMTAREVMETTFYTLRPETSIAEALGVFQQAREEQGRTAFGLVVTDAAGRLVGMFSMYDFLLLLRPKHIHIWGEMKDVDLAGMADEAYRRTRGMLVGDVMTTEVVTIAPDTHLLAIVDLMIKKHIRRLPVLEDGRVAGIVYLSRVFNHLLARWA
jgi:CBS domain-containing protein